MQLFAYERVSDSGAAIHALSLDAEASFIAGGTELLNWMKEGISSPTRLIDINELPLDAITADQHGLRIGALARMSDVAAHPLVRSDYPAIAQALELSASAQLRNMASMGGNLMQRTRCPYYRAETLLPCNKRVPGSGCAALHGENRGHAIFGWSEACVATHPSDVAVALAALDAVVHIRGRQGERSVPLTDFHRLPGNTPERDSVLQHGELITQIEVPASAAARRSHYLKVRERRSYEFALVSAAVSLDLDGDTIRAARIALGGVAPKPWRLPTAESHLRAAKLTETALRAALDAAFNDARPLAQNAFKIELAKRTAVRALAVAGGLA
jgi:xanthine dehydrogenase YagS FAD-binding subunit